MAVARREVSTQRGVDVTREKTPVAEDFWIPEQHKHMGSAVPYTALPDKAKAKSADMTCMVKVWQPSLQIS